MTEEEKKEYQKLADDAAQVAISALSYVKPYQGFAIAVGELSSM